MTERMEKYRFYTEEGDKAKGNYSKKYFPTACM